MKLLAKKMHIEDGVKGDAAAHGSDIEEKTSPIRSLACSTKFYPLNIVIIDTYCG